MADKREITKVEKQIIKDIMSRSNYDEEEASKIAKEMIDFGYTIHEQDYFKLKEALKFLCEELEIKLCYTNWMSLDEEYYLDYRSDIDLKTLHKITKEKYNLLGEVLSNER